MDAKTMMIEYAKQHNDGKIYTDEEFVGKMVVEGVAIARTPASVTTARGKREGRTIIVTETTKTKTMQVVNGKLVNGETETTTEIFRVDI